MAKAKKRGCGLCGEPGHNARTCKKSRAKASAKPTRASAAPAGPQTAPLDEPPVVAEQLRLRADWLRTQLERIEPWKRELELIDRLIADLAELQPEVA